MSIFTDLFKRQPKVVVTGDSKYIKNAMSKALEVNTYNESPHKSGTVYTCISILSNTMARMPLELYENDGDGGKVKAKNDVRYDLLHYNVSNYMTTFDFLRTLEAHRNEYGNAYAYILRGGDGKPKSFEIINPERVTNFKIVNNELFYKIKKVSKEEGNTEEFDVINASDMLHLKNYSVDGIFGMNPIDALSTFLGVNYKGLKTLDNFLENNAAASKIVEMVEAGNLTPDKMQQLMKMWKEEVQGPSNAGGIWVAPPYGKVTTNSIDLQAVQFLDTIKFTSNQTASLFGVPPYLVGNYESSKFNNVEQLQLIFKVNSIAAIAKMYRAEFEFKLLSTEERKAGMSIEFNIDSLIEADYATKIEGYQKLIQNGVMTPNQVARLEGLPTYEQGNNYYVSNNHLAVDMYIQKKQLEVEKMRSEIKKLETPQ